MPENRYETLKRVRCDIVKAGEARVFIDGREYGRVRRIRTKVRGKECWRWTGETTNGDRLAIAEHDRIYAARAVVSAVLWDVQSGKDIPIEVTHA